MAKTETSEQNIILTKDTAGALKGISAIEIMCGHIGLLLSLPFLYPFRKAGILFVGLFFMISGYGLYKSKETKPGYFKHFLLRRELLLFVPAYLIHIAMEFLVYGRTWHHSLKESLWYILPQNFLTELIWFVKELAIFYLLFYLLYRFLKTKIANICMLLLTIVMVGGLFVLDGKYSIGEPWYGSSFCFLLGIMYAQKEEKVNTFLQKKWLLKNIGLFALLAANIALFFVFKWNNVFDLVVFRNVAALCFSVWVLSLLQKVRFNFRPFNFLGGISYEIFLCHNAYIVLFTKDYIPEIATLFLVIVVTVITAFILHFPLAQIEKGIRKI